MTNLVIPEPKKTLIPVHGSDEFFPVRRVYCIGRNYAAHTIEMGFDPDKEPPFFFQKNTDNIDNFPSLNIYLISERLKINEFTNVQFIDQNPIGRSSRSNPATYLKVYDDIRNLYAKIPQSVSKGFKSKFFSFNTDGGRCDECKGEGVVRIEMQFMADVELECEICKGKRFKDEVTAIKYNGISIDMLLKMTVDECIQFFRKYNQTKIVNKLLPLQSVGLGYVSLGQSSNTLSGGEAQRIKLASFIGKGDQIEKTFFIFDEPTTGLHFHDIKKLLSTFEKLKVMGHSLLVIEHNLEMIKCADYIIDLGPEGGNKGGEVVAKGTPEQIIKSKDSYTGKYLKNKI